MLLQINVILHLFETDYKINSQKIFPYLIKRKYLVLWCLFLFCSLDLFIFIMKKIKDAYRKDIKRTSNHIK